MARPSKNIPVPIPQNISPIGKNIIKLRKAHELTQAEISKQMKISIKQISDYENGKVHMNDEMIIRFAILFNVSTDVLLGLKEDDNSNEVINISFIKKLQDLESLPEPKKKNIIKIIDKFLKDD